MAAQNYYDTLGVPKNASQADIRQAFRKLARTYHPDLNPGDKAAEERFKQISEANEVLSDTENRKNYDKYGDNWRHADRIESQFGAGGAPFTWRSGRQRRGATGQSGFGDFSGFEDLLGGFGNVHGSPAAAASKRSLETDVDVTLDEAYTGTNRRITITEGGRERRIEVDIPPGVDDGSVVRVRPGGSREILLKVTVEPHPRFTRRGNDLYQDIDVPFEDAILGSKAAVRTISGRLEVTVPAESRNGQHIRLAGQGMPKLGEPESRGDMYVVVRPVMPRDLSDEERGLVERLKAARSGRG